MRIHHRSPSSPRPAFTLIELIVAMTIIAVLAALAVAIIPQMQDTQRVTNGVDKVQGALFIAKQMALKDQQPRGVRLLLDPADGLVHSMQYIEQPDYFLAPTNANPALSSYLYGVQFLPNNQPPAPNPFVGYFNNVDFFGGNPGNPALWPVQPNDYLDLMGNNKADGLYKIVSVSSSWTPGVGDTLTLASPLPTGSLLVPQPVVDSRLEYYISNPPVPNIAPQPPAVDAVQRLSYRILRGPRPMTGQQEIALPTDVVVDCQRSSSHPAPVGVPPQSGSLVPADSQSNQFDILFAPSGKVLRDAGNQGKVVLWVWDSTPGTGGGSQTLVVVYTRTGAIAAHPVDVGGLNPYQFVQDGRSSGM